MSHARIMGWVRLEPESNQLLPPDRFGSVKCYKQEAHGSAHGRPQAALSPRLRSRRPCPPPSSLDTTAQTLTPIPIPTQSTRLRWPRTAAPPSDRRPTRSCLLISSPPEGAGILRLFSHAIPPAFRGLSFPLWLWTSVRTFYRLVLNLVVVVFTSLSSRLVLEV